MNTTETQAQAPRSCRILRRTDAIHPFRFGNGTGGCHVRRRKKHFELLALQGRVIEVPEVGAIRIVLADCTNTARHVGVAVDMFTSIVGAR